jgi:uncharacterized DUF497 family protein
MTEYFELEDMRFEWDSLKAESNFRKHGVSFQEAALTFLDLSQQILLEPLHSEEESRFIALGWSGRFVLVVIHVERGGTIRIISAREATGRERTDYEQNAIGR